MNVTRTPKRPRTTADPIDDLLTQAADRADDPRLRDWLLALQNSGERGRSADHTESPRRGAGESEE